MLLETLVYAASLPGTPAAARPHLAGAVGLWARGRRQRRAWAEHLTNTRRFLASAAPRGGETVVVLGSGSLLDIPLDILAGGFSTVVLADLVHLLPARRAIRRYPNVRVEWRDLAGTDALAFAETLWRADWVVSVNLVSQLGVGAADGDERRVIDAHLDGLRNLPCKATLITDLSYRVLNRSGAETETLDLLYGRAMPPPDRQWLWEVAPFGEESPSTRRIHTVAAYADWQAAGAR